MAGAVGDREVARSESLKLVSSTNRAGRGTASRSLHRGVWIPVRNVLTGPEPRKEERKAAPAGMGLREREQPQWDLQNGLEMSALVTC